MRTTIHFLGFIMVLFLSLSLTSCGGSSQETTDEGQNDTSEQVDASSDQAPENDKTGPEYTSAYLCPMHCEGSGSNEPGTCPVCGMDYVAKAELDKREAEHSHDGHDHDGHSHDGHEH